MGLAEIYHEFEGRNLNYIADCSNEISVMIKLRATFKENSRIQQLAYYFITLNTYEMEELYGEIEQYRQIEKELSGIPG